MSRLLIVDDDREFAAAAATLAEQEGFEVTIAATLADARQRLGDARFDLLLLDLQLPDGHGLDLLHEVDLIPHGRIVVVTGNPTLESAMRAVTEPVIEYLVKPIDPDRWLDMLRETQRIQPLASDLQLMRTGLLGRSQVVRETVATLLRIAPTDASVLITGESGTGKELAAHTLHTASDRSGEFIAINCGAIPSEVAAHELFGYELASYSVAGGRQINVFDRAINGTLFLDEVTEMPPALQVYLLRAIEATAMTRADPGADAPPRVVAATRHDPQQAVAEGRLREDLYYRLADVIVPMAPLRDRDEDAVLLARAFIDRLNARYGKRKRLARGAERVLLRHLWPGNVRELLSAVQRAYLLENDDAIAVLPAPSPSDAINETDTTLVFSIGMTLADIERRMLLKTLSHFKNDKTAAARSLGISVRTVHNQLARLAKEPSGQEPPSIQRGQERHA